MFRFLYAAFLFLSILPQSVPGAPIQPIVGLPSSYTPGQPVEFEVRLPTISNLGSYNIDVALEGNAGTAGTDFFFDTARTVPASTSYVFPSATNFFDAATIDSSTLHRITLTDFDFAGVDVVAGTNDRVATVVFQTLATYDGTLNVFVDAPLLLLDTPDEVPTPVEGFAEIQANIEESGPVVLPPVPEPPSVELCGLALSIVLLQSFASRLR
jgi:hypothetical protein